MTAAKLPATGVGAVLVGFRVPAASGAGRLLVRPTGSQSAGTTVTSFGRSGATDATFLAKLGGDGAVDIRASAGRPSVAVSVLGYVPETAPLVVPESVPSASSTSLGASTRTVQLTGRAGIPANATAVLVALETSAKRAGTATAWTTGLPIATAGHAFPAGNHTTLLTLAPSTAGRISLRSLSGSASARLRVLGWASPGTTVAPLPRPTALGTVVPGGVRAVAVAGRAGIPATAQDVVFGVNAARGARVRVWTNARGTGSPVLDTTSRGGAVTSWLPVPSGRKVAVKVTGTRAKTRLTAMGYVSSLGSQTLSFVPKVGTRLLGSGDIVGTGDGTVDLARSAGPVQTGDHVLARPAGGTPFIGQITNVTTGAGGVRTLSLAAAELSAAFDDYDATYDGALLSSIATPATSARGARVQGARAAAGAAAAAGLGAPDKIGLQFFKNDWWSCSASLPVAQLVNIDAEYSGDIHFAVDLSQRSLDFSAKGSLKVTFTFLGKASVSCTLTAADNPDIYPRIPLGTSGVAVKFGGKAEFEATTPDVTDGGTFSVTAGLNAYAGYYYFDGLSGGTTTVAPIGDVSANYDGLSLSFRPSLFIAVAPMLPPGLEENLDANASVSIGAELAVGVPDTLRGPRCLDVTLQPTIETGVDAVVAFLGLDAKFTWEGAKWEGPKTELYKGPCWGWTGTVTYEAVGETTPACEGCEYFIRDDHATLTLDPQPARFIAGDIYQPFSWTASTHYRYVGAFWPDWGTRCWTDVAGTGSGYHPWGGTPEMQVEPFLVRDIPANGDGPLPRRFQAMVNEYPVDELTTVGGGDPPCGTYSSPGSGFIYVVPDLDPAEHPLPFWASSSANYTWDNGNTEIPQRVTYAVQRKEFVRS
ncbi:MAG: hypothetical protein ABWX84_07355 [Nocardioides sp.]